jgi:hypothetical protein
MRISNYLSHQWDFAAPSGISEDQLCGLFDALHNIAIRSMHRGVTEALSDKACFGLEDGLFVESEAFRTQRALLQDRPFALRSQHALLTVCLGVTSNDELRDVLESSCGVPSEVSVNNSESEVNLLSAFTPPGAQYNPDLRQYDPAAQSSSSSSSTVPQSTSKALHAAEGSADHWRSFWMVAAHEAEARAAAEAAAILLQEQQLLKQQKEAAALTAALAEQQRVFAVSQMSFAYDPEDGDDRVEEQREEEKEGAQGSSSESMALSDEEMLRGADLALQSQGGR